MKDHEKAKLVNELTAIAKQYGQTQQLRDRIAHCVLPAIDAASQCTEIVEAKNVVNSAQTTPIA